MDDLIKQYVSNMETLTEETRREMDFFSLALYLQELNRVEELCKFELGDDIDE